MSTATTPPRRRARTQADRRAETRAALLAATIECLAKYGYSGTTTVRIAELAGVSRGAQIPYFRTRAELVGAAIAHLAEQRARAVHAHFAAGPVSMEKALDVLWREHQGSAFDAAVELWIAARTDADLRRQLRRAEREVMKTIAREAEAALGTRARRPGFGEDLVFALATIRGLALLRISEGGSSKAVDALWEKARERLRRVLD
jgi:AcrR family transcriptional regulator